MSLLSGSGLIPVALSAGFLPAAVARSPLLSRTALSQKEIKSSIRKGWFLAAFCSLFLPAGFALFSSRVPGAPFSARPRSVSIMVSRKVLRDSSVSPIFYLHQHLQIAAKKNRKHKPTQFKWRGLSGSGTYRSDHVPPDHVAVATHRRGTQGQPRLVTESQTVIRKSKDEGPSSGGCILLCGQIPEATLGSVLLALGHVLGPGPANYKFPMTGRSSHRLRSAKQPCESHRSKILAQAHRHRCNFLGQAHRHPWQENLKKKVCPGATQPGPTDCRALHLDIAAGRHGHLTRPCPGATQLGPADRRAFHLKITPGRHLTRPYPTATQSAPLTAELCTEIFLPGTTCPGDKQLGPADCRAPHVDIPPGYHLLGPVRAPNDSALFTAELSA